MGWWRSARCALVGCALTVLLASAAPAWAGAAAPASGWHYGGRILRGPIVRAIPNGLACPSLSLCLGTDTSGQVLVSHDPSGGARTWRVFNVDPNHLVADITCPSLRRCYALDATRTDGVLLTTTDPGASNPHWTHFGLGTFLDQFTGLSCPTTSFCAVSEQSGRVMTSTDPTGGSSAWRTSTFEPVCPPYYVYGHGGIVTCDQPLLAIDCPTATLCAAVDPVGRVYVSSRPGQDGSWLTGPLGPNTTPFGQLTSLACPTTTFCAVTSPYTTVGIFNPSSRASPLRLSSTGGEAFQVWCASATTCFATAPDNGGDDVIHTTTNADAAHPRWSASSLPDQPEAVSCPSATQCFALGFFGGALSWTAPA